MKTDYPVCASIIGNSPLTCEGLPLSVSVCLLNSCNS
jgi:hypothetical protein